MRIVQSGTNLHLIGNFQKMAQRLASPAAQTELHRGVIDAGKKVKTRVQKAVHRQMALKPGNYQSYVVAGTRGVPKRATLSYEIYGVKKGASIEKYKGLMAIKAGGRAAIRLNTGNSIDDSGTVRSGVWNRVRVFKRSFATGSGFFAFLPASAGSSSVAPKVLWTRGYKPGQPRSADGRFAPTGKRYGKIRRLFGPALDKEIPQDESLQIFLKEGPDLLAKAVSKRVVKLMRF